MKPKTKTVMIKQMPVATWARLKNEANAVGMKFHAYVIQRLEREETK